MKCCFYPVNAFLMWLIMTGNNELPVITPFLPVLDGNSPKCTVERKGGQLTLFQIKK